VKPEKDSEEKGRERESERETTFCLLIFYLLLDPKPRVSQRVQIEREKKKRVAEK
jgi:hypothetical protein